MAAAEYYTGASMHTPAASSSYQHPQYFQSSPNIISTPPQYNYSNPPAYQPVSHESKPAVHFAPSPKPSQQQHRPSFSNQAPIPIPHQHQQHRPSFSNQYPNSSQQNLQSRPSQSNSYHGTPPRQGFSAPVAHHHYPGRPEMYDNPSQHSVSEGYASDPEPHRRRHRRHEHKDDREIKDSSKKDRSRSRNADGLIGAAGGGLIGDLIFPGLGTVGGALAGWIGGKDFGKHRKNREDRHEKEQEAWERKYRSRSHSNERRDSSRARRSYERHKSDY